MSFFKVSDSSANVSVRSLIALWILVFFLLTTVSLSRNFLPPLNNLLPRVLIFQESYQAFDHINPKLIDWSTQRHKN
jgi:hypothetical protein